MTGCSRFLYTLMGWKNQSFLTRMSFLPGVFSAFRKGQVDAPYIVFKTFRAYYPDRAEHPICFCLFQQMFTGR
jgi:hypothetical protein